MNESEALTSPKIEDPTEDPSLLYISKYLSELEEIDSVNFDKYGMNY